MRWKRVGGRRCKTKDGGRKMAKPRIWRGLADRSWYFATWHMVAILHIVDHGAGIDETNGRRIMAIRSTNFPQGNKGKQLHLITAAQVHLARTSYFT